MIILIYDKPWQSFYAHKWIDAINEEIKSMNDNDVWDLV